MRVVHVFKDYYPPVRGGVEQHINDVVHGMREIGPFEAAVITSSRSRSRMVADDDGVRVVRLPELARVASTPLQPRLVAELRQLRADVVHLHAPNPGAEVAWLSARPGISLVVTYHADNPRTGTTSAATALRRALAPVYEPVQQRLLRRARRIVVSSPPMADRPALRDHRDRVRIVPFGIESDRWDHRPPGADEIRSRYPGPLVVFLGRLVHYKGLDTLADASRQLDATCLVVGGGPVRQLVNAPANVVWVGEVRDHERADYYHAADVFVLPSTSPAETFGIAMLEAMACGTPAVCTELGTGTSWLNRHGETGLVVPPGDPGALSAALRELLGNDEVRRAYGAAARDRVARSFTRRGMIEGLARVYQQAATEGP